MASNDLYKLYHNSFAFNRYLFPDPDEQIQSIPGEANSKGEYHADPLETRTSCPYAANCNSLEYIFH